MEISPKYQMALIEKVEKKYGNFTYHIIELHNT